MAKSKKTAQSVEPSSPPELFSSAIAEGQALITQGKSKVEAAMAMFRLIGDQPQEAVLQAFIEGASLTPKGALTYWYNCKRKIAKEMKKVD